jgi:hypothetical protein
VSRFNKSWIALAGAAGVGATLIADGWQGADYFTFAAAVLTAVGVGLVPNSG